FASLRKTFGFHKPAHRLLEALQRIAVLLIADKIRAFLKTHRRFLNPHRHLSLDSNRRSWPVINSVLLVPPTPNSPSASLSRDLLSALRALCNHIVSAVYVNRLPGDV